MHPAARDEQRWIGRSPDILGRCHRPVEMQQCFARSAERQCVLGGGERIAPGGLPRAGLEAVIRKSVDDLWRPRRRLLLERHGDRRVQRHAFARQQARPHRLARERVAKRKAVCRLLDDELRVDELLDDREQLTLFVPRQCLE